MTRAETRKGVIAAAAAVLVAALSAAPLARAAAPEMSASLAPTASKTTALLESSVVRISGTWPDSCALRVEKWRLDGADIDVVVRVSDIGCANVATPFRLSVTPSSNGGPLLLAPLVYRVRLLAHRGNEAPSLAAFALLDASRATASPESGFWWSVADATTGPALPATGLAIERQEDRIAVTLYGFDREGAPTWYFGNAPLVGRAAHVALSAIANGNDAFDAPTSAPTIDAGPTLDLDFSAPSRAIGYLSRRAGFAEGAPLDVHALAFSRLAFDTSQAGAAWRGSWVLVRDDTPDARRIELGQLTTTDGDGFRLTDAAQSLALDCRVDGDAAPTLCTLRDADGRETARFDAISLDRFDGIASDRARVRLIRLPK